MGREDVLVREWTGFAYKLAGLYYLPGADQDDVKQEALVGLLSAIRDFKPELGASFASFVRLCVTRRLDTALKFHLRQKHRLLNDSVRVLRSDDGHVIEAVESIESFHNRDPVLHLIASEELREIAGCVQTLTPRERRAITGIANGQTYCQIEGSPEGTKPKWVDNAAQRARKKLAARPKHRIDRRETA